MSLMPYEHHAGLFVRAPLTAVADCLVGWGNQPEVGRLTRARHVTTTLQRAWALVGERHFQPSRAFLIPITDSWTAFFNNHRDEYLAQAELYILCERLKTETCFFYVDERADSIYRGSAQFCYYRPDGQEVIQRQVMSYKESRWTFQQSGPAAPFELCDRYALPKVRARLDAELLKHYGRSLGIPFWDPETYGTKAVLLNWNTKPVMSASQAEALLRQAASSAGIRTVQVISKPEAEGWLRRLWNQVRGR
jgi:hypothetical protein